MNDLLKTSKWTLEKVMAGFKCFLIKVKVGEAFILFIYFFFISPRYCLFVLLSAFQQCYVKLTWPNVIKLCSEAKLGQLKSSNVAQTLFVFNPYFFLIY